MYHTNKHSLISHMYRNLDKFCDGNCKQCEMRSYRIAIIKLESLYKKFKINHLAVCWIFINV